MTTVVIMVGKPSFDSAEVLARAARVFAERGYAGASITNLVETTGLLRGSLYGAFGSKAELFRLAYAEAARSASAEVLLDLTVVALMERAKHDRAVAQEARRVLDTLDGGEIAPAEQIYRRLVARAGIATGATSRETDGGRDHG